MSVRERFPHPYKECFVLLSNQCGISQFILFRGLVSLLAHRLVSSLLQPMWDLTIHPPSGPSVLTGTPPCVHLLLEFSLLANTSLDVWF